MKYVCFDNILSELFLSPNTTADFNFINIPVGCVLLHICVPKY